MPNRCFRSPKGRSGKSTKRERPKEERRAHSYKASSLVGKKKHAESERQRADSGRERQHIRQRTETARHRQTVYMLVGN